MDKTIKELYVSPELERLEILAESFICASGEGGTDAPTPVFDWGNEV